MDRFQIQRLRTKIFNWASLLYLETRLGCATVHCSRDMPTPSPLRAVIFMRKMARGRLKEAQTGSKSVRLTGWSGGVYRGEFMLSPRTHWQTLPGCVYLTKSAASAKVTIAMAEPEVLTAIDPMLFDLHT